MKLTSGLLIFLSLLLITACHSSPKKEEAPTPGEPEVEIKSSPVPAKPGDLPSITKEGENEMGRFSSSGTKIIFQSRNRSNHKTTQIYLLNLKNSRERRITYNDGDDSTPTFDPTGKYILYASTTDESKEHPDAAAPTYAADPTNLIESKAGYQEVYESEADGSHILRLTHAVGYDGQGSYSPDGKRIVFISQRSGDFEIYLMDSKGRNQRRWISSTDFQGHPHYSPNGKLIVWETRSSGKGPVQIKVADLSGHHSLQITSNESVNRDPTWTPDGKRIVFSSNRGDPKIFSLYVMNGDGTCLKRITQWNDPLHPIADLSPDVSPDGKKILFTSNRSGANQLYLIDFNEPAECLSEKP